MTKEEKRAYDHGRVLARQQRLAAAGNAPRFCNTCKETKPCNAFYPSCGTCCIACAKTKAAPSVEHRRQYVRAWKARNTTKVKDWFAANKEWRSEYMRQWRQTHLEQRTKDYAEWARTNKDKVNANVMRRQIARRRATPVWVDSDRVRAFYAEALRLTRETGIRHEVDHIIPIRHPLVCGLHCEANLQVITRADNKRKSNRFTPGTQSRQPTYRPASMDLR